jgi:Spy/CpxP family protein refolding chaperone
VKRGALVLLLLLSLGANVGLVGLAIGRRAAGERWRSVGAGEIRPPEQFGRRMADRLELGDDQRVRFVEIQRRLVDRAAAGRRRIADLRAELRREVLAAEPDRAAIEAALDRLAREEAMLNRAFVESVLESRAVLDDRQAERYLRFLERFAPGRRGPGPEAPGGRWPRAEPPGGRPQR